MAITEDVVAVGQLWVSRSRTAPRTVEIIYVGMTGTEVDVRDIETGRESAMRTVSLTSRFRLAHDQEGGRS